MRYYNICIVLLLLTFYPGFCGAEEWSCIIGNYHIQDIAIQDDSLWLATDIGIVHYNSIDKTVIEYTTEDGLYHNWVGSIVVDSDGIVWAATAGGVCYYDGMVWRRSLKQGSAFTMFIDEEGLIWCGGSNLRGGDLIDEHYRPGSYELASYNGEYWRSYYLGIYNVFSMIVLNDKLYYAGGIKGAFEYDWNESRLLVDDEEIYSLTSIDDDILIGSSNGLYRWNGTESEKIHTDFFYALYTGKKGIVWGGIYKLYKFDGDIFEKFDLPEDVYVNCIEESDHGTLYIGTGSGLYEFSETVLSIEADDTPADFEITGIYPNPFNPVTNMEYIIDSGGMTSIDIYNTAGQRVINLISDFIPAGKHDVTWNGCNESGHLVSSGVYIIRLSHGYQSESRAITLVR